MRERLQKLIASAGLCSRRQAELWISEGRVCVNGKTAALGESADLAEDRIEVDGVALKAAPKLRYLLLHKPRGYVTTLSDEKGRPCISDLLKDLDERVFPVGRLDYDSEGLLLCTNDGDLANRLMHPSHEIPKTYLVWVSAYREGGEELLSRPIVLDGRPIAPPTVRLWERAGNSARFEITIHEGRNRQIRRMCEAAGMKVTRLLRIAEGPIRLGRLPKGSYRDLTSAELSTLKKFC